MSEYAEIDKALFIKRLKLACVLKDISRSGLCEKTGISIATLNNIFAGKPVSLKRIKELIAATGMTEKSFIKLAG